MRTKVWILGWLLVAGLSGCPEDKFPCNDIPCDPDCWYELSGDGESCECVCDGDDDDDGDPCSLTGLPQAVDGAAWANPAVYPSIPLRVEVNGDVTGVSASLDTGSSGPGEELAPGEWVLTLLIDGLEETVHPVVISADCGDGSVQTTILDLGVGTQGVQLTDFDEAGLTTTPRIHRVGDALYLTWVATYSEQREAWMQRVDGAGRLQGDRIQLTEAGEADTLYAFTAFGTTSVAVLYQEPGAPYVNKLRILDLEGVELLAPLDLTPEAGAGQPRGDVTFDGEAFVAAYRVYLDTGVEEVRWLRIPEDTLLPIGPVVASSSGDGDPIAGFDPFVFVNVEAVGEVSVVSFVRYRWDDWLEMDLPKTQVATLDADGILVDEQYAGPEAEWTWAWEARLGSLGDDLLLIWSLSDLMDPDPNSPTLFRGETIGSDGILAQGTYQVMLDDAPFDRMDPFVMEYPDHTGVLLWADLRSYEETPESGRIELWVAAVDAELAVGDGVVIDHAVFIAGSSELNGAAAGTNVVMTWEDERHGNGLLDMRSEMVVETAWF